MTLLATPVNAKTPYGPASKALVMVDMDILCNAVVLPDAARCFSIMFLDAKSLLLGTPTVG